MHHSEHSPLMTEFTKQLTDTASKRINELAEKLGATGEFPNGKVAEHDEGEIRFAVVSDYERKLVFLDFGKSVRSVGMTPHQAREFAETLNQHARRASGIIEIGKPDRTEHVADGGDPQL